VRIVARQVGQEGDRLAVLDERGTLPGRGAYLCRAPGSPAPAPACLESALRRGSIQRTLRSAVPLDPKIVESVGR
jgi:predicted RNA-binding protein YlxR (DUF448 family)